MSLLSLVSTHGDESLQVQPNKDCERFPAKKYGTPPSLSSAHLNRLSGNLHSKKSSIHDQLALIENALNSEGNLPTSSAAEVTAKDCDTLDIMQFEENDLIAFLGCDGY